MNSNYFINASLTNKSPWFAESSTKLPTQEMLVAVGTGARSAAALRWATEHAVRLGLRLRLVHVTSQHWPHALVESLRSWARRETSGRINEQDFLVERGEPAELIVREASRPDVKLVVIGGLPREMSQDAARFCRTVLRRCPRPMLFVGPQGAHPVVLAATDCSDPALPVLTEAWRLAAVLGDYSS